MVVHCWVQVAVWSGVLIRHHQDALCILRSLSVSLFVASVTPQHDARRNSVLQECQGKTCHFAMHGPCLQLLTCVAKNKIR
jgi:hypothetical protein